MRLGRRLATLAATAFAATAAVPAVAAASSLWVSPQPVKSPFNSCSAPGYNAIQDAINVNASPSTIHVCPGTYKEQIHIEKELTILASIGSKLQLPASPTNTTTACDVQEPGYEEQDLVAICGKGTVKISGLTVEGRWSGENCAQQYFGILVGGSANLILTNSKVLHAGAEPINGCQQGVGLQIGHNFNSQVGTATLSGGDLIEGYQKNGITVDGPGSKATITGITIKSEPTNQIAQNGIQISRGAVAKITSSTIEGNECNVASCGSNEFGFSPWQEEEDATGVLVYKGGAGSSVTKSTINENDIGVYNLSQAETTKPQTVVTNNTMKGNRYWGVALDQGFATVSKNTISGPGRVGIQIVQYDEPHNGLPKQEFGPKGTGTEDAISEMTVCAVEGLSDNGANDQFGSLKLTNSLSKFTSNAKPVCNNNTTGKLVISVG